MDVPSRTAAPTCTRVCPVGIVILSGSERCRRVGGVLIRAGFHGQVKPVPGEGVLLAPLITVHPGSIHS